MMLVALLAMAALGTDDKEADEAVKRFRQSFANPSPTARATALLELGRVPHEKTLKTIIPFLSGDVPEVRAAAAKAMGSFADYKKLASPMLLAGLSSNAKEYDVKAAIFGSMGTLNDDMFLSEVVKGFKEDRVKVAKAALSAAGSMRRKELIDPMIDLGKDIEKWIKNKQSGGYRGDDGQQGDENQQKTRLEDLQKHLVKCLAQITGEKWGTFKEWEIWWGRRKATFEVPPPEESKKK